MRSIRPGGLALVLAVVFVSTTLTEGIASAQAVVWQSKVSDRRRVSVSRDLEQLYSGLSGSSAMTTRKLVVSSTKTLETQMRETGLFAGHFFPASLDRILCRLNSEVCSFTTDDDGQKVAQWRARPGDSVIVPDITLTTIVLPAPYESRGASRSLRQIVTIDREGCKAYDKECKALLANLNKSSIEELESHHDKMIVPTLTYRVSLNEPVAADLRETPAGRLLGATLEVSLETSAITDANFDSQKTLFADIDHPMAADVPLGPLPYSSRVAVFDTVVDRTHIDLGADNIQYLGEPPDVNAICHDDSHSACKHGTHVAGVIGARINGLGIVGVNPAVHISAYGLFPYDIGGGGVADHKLVEALMSGLQQWPIDVVNMSFSYVLRNGLGRDGVQDVIKTLDKTLFVAAAGNAPKYTDGAVLSAGACDVRPACFSYDNVLSVVAYQPSGNLLLRESNRGQAFDVGAPGDLLSTVPIDGYENEAGTSQATAVVSGLASLLYAQDPRLEPKVAKERIIYTSRFSSALLENSFGGVIDVKRAMNWSAAQIVLNGSPEVRHATLRNADTVIDFLHEGSNEPDSIKAGDLRRLATMPDGRKAMFFIERKTGRLRRYVDVILIANAPNTLTLTTDDKQLAGSMTAGGLPLQAVTDYTASLK